MVVRSPLEEGYDGGNGDGDDDDDDYYDDDYDDYDDNDDGFGKEDHDNDDDNEDGNDDHHRKTPFPTSQRFWTKALSFLPSWNIFAMKNCPSLDFV